MAAKNRPQVVATVDRNASESWKFTSLNLAAAPKSQEI